jgi:hypothetical protein
MGCSIRLAEGLKYSAQKHVILLNIWLWIGKIFRVKDMPTPRINAWAVVLNFYVYFIGGSTAKKQHTGIVERLNLFIHDWESLNPLNYPRETPKAVVSKKYRKIYIFGGCEVFKDNYFIEVYDIGQVNDLEIEEGLDYDPEGNKNNWVQSGILETTLIEPFDSNKSHPVMIDDNVYFSAKELFDQPFNSAYLKKSKKLMNNQNSWVNDDELIFIIQYSTIANPLPRVFVLNPIFDNIKELEVNGLCSEYSSYNKKAVIFDKLSSWIYAFNDVIPGDYDYLDLNLECLTWKSFYFNYV